eukprot:TRINITY_DN15328_c0_g1_i1.p1 TRINITY_DN15328_c0_g1~~TRINITY_DN15328_c0_g1_i1.p1  ORF type:complete len:1767 (+),score=237.32 TRINITY_DN15328_c0_g1_i1:47-5347(+)
MAFASDSHVEVAANTTDGLRRVSTSPRSLTSRNAGDPFFEFPEEEERTLEPSPRAATLNGQPPVVPTGPEPLKETVVERMFAVETYNHSMEGRSLRIFGPGHPVRRFCYSFIYHPVTQQVLNVLVWFSAFSVAFMGNNPSRFFEISDIVVLAVFVTEVILKIIARGAILGRGAYLRQPANIFDFALVMLALIAMIGEVNGVKALRAFRAIRPLRSIRFLSGVVGILSSLQRTIPMLIDNVLMMVFCFVLFSSFAVEFFRNSLSRACVSADIGGVVLPMRPCKNFTSVSGVTTSGCPEESICIKVSNPHDGWTNFDSFTSALLTLFQIVSLDDWATYMFTLQRAELYMPTGIWFLVVISVCVFIVINLFIAVISGVFAQIAEEERASAFVSRKARKLARLRAEATATTIVVAAIATAAATADPDTPDCLFSLTDDALVAITTPRTTESLTPRTMGSVDSSQGKASLYRRVERTAKETWNKVPDVPQCIQNPCQRIVFSRIFDSVVAVTILVNSLVQALEYEGMPDRLETVVQNADIVFWPLFAIEMLLKLAALGVAGYAKKPHNAFDGFLVILSGIGFFTQTGGRLSVLRIVRLLRVLRLFKRLTKLRIIILSSLGSIPRVVNLCIFAVLTILIFTLLGHALFARTKAETTRYPTRLHFDTFGQSALTLFVIITGDNWTEPMYSAMSTKGAFAAAYFVSYYIFVAWVLLNMFTALVLEQYSSKKEELEQKLLTERSVPFFSLAQLFPQEKSSGRNRQRAVTLSEHLRTLRTTPRVDGTVQRNLSPAPSRGEEIAQEDGETIPVQAPPTPASPSETAEDENENGTDKPTQADPRPSVAYSSPRASETDPVGGTVDFAAVPSKVLTKRQVILPPLQIERVTTSYSGRTPGTSQPRSAASRRVRFLDADAVGSPAGASGLAMEAKSLPQLRSLRDARGLQEFFHEAEVPPPVRCPIPDLMFLRRYAFSLATHSAFELFDVASIIISVFIMAFEPPPSAIRAENNTRPPWLQICDAVFLVIFTFVLLTKITAFGLYKHPESLLRSSWNLLDLFIVFSMYLSFALPFTKAFRNLRVFRPLRFIRKVETLRVVIRALVSSVPAILQVFCVTIFLFFVLSLIGVSLLRGALKACNDGSVDGFSTCNGLFFAESDVGEAVLTPRAWQGADTLNFDNVYRAQMSLLEIASMAGWSDTLFVAMDSRGRDRQPRENANAPIAIFFVVVVLVGGIFMVNIFIGVIVDSIEKNRGQFFLTPEQQQWQSLKRMLASFHPPRSRPRKTLPEWRRPFWDMCRRSRRFDYAVMCVIVLHVVALSVQRSLPETSTYRSAMLAVNGFFLLVYWAEAGVRFAALGRGYLASNWNRWDFFVLVSGSALFFLEVSPLGKNMAVVTFARIIRVARIIRLVRVRKGLEVIFNTLLTAVPSVANVVLLVAILMLTYAFVGRAAFANTRYLSSLNRDINFRLFSRIMFMLFRNLTLDSWNGILHDCNTGPPLRCTKNSMFNDCGSWQAYPFFFSFFVVGSFVFVNLVASIILDNFNHCFTFNTTKVWLTDEHLREFKLVWQTFDPASSGSVPLYLLPHILQYLYAEGHPLGFSPIKFKNTVLLMRAQLVARAKNEKHKKKLENRMLFGTILRTLVVNRLADPEAALFGKDLAEFLLLHDLALLTVAGQRVCSALHTNYLLTVWIPSNISEAGRACLRRVRQFIRRCGRERLKTSKFAPPRIAFEALKWYVRSQLYLFCAATQEHIRCKKRVGERRNSEELLDRLAESDDILVL